MLALRAVPPHLIPVYPVLTFVDSKSGVSGAGRKLSLTTHFCEVNESFRPYSIGRAHRHTSELDQELAAWGVKDLNVTFSPHLLPVSRGILSTMYVTLEPGWSVERLVELYRAQYAGEPFVHVLPADGASGGAPSAGASSAGGSSGTPALADAASDDTVVS